MCLSLLDIFRLLSVCFRLLFIRSSIIFMRLAVFMITNNWCIPYFSLKAATNGFLESPRAVGRSSSQGPMKRKSASSPVSSMLKTATVPPNSFTLEEYPAAGYTLQNQSSQAGCVAILLTYHSRCSNYQAQICGLDQFINFIHPVWYLTKPNHPRTG